MTKPRRGITLFEVLLAIAILGTSLAAIGMLFRTGSRAAIEARELTKAQLLAETIMAEISAGAISSQATSQQPDQTNPDWTYSIESDSSSQQGLLMVTVTMQKADVVANAKRAPLTYTLVRWMVDPQIDLAAPPAESSSSSTSSSTDSSGSGSGSSSGTGSGASSGGGNTGGVN